MLPKRATFALLITAGTLALLLNFKTPDAPATTPLIAANAAVTRIGTASTGTGAAQAGTPGDGKSGTYTGTAVQSRYGAVQVQVTLSSGKITDVQMLQYPSTDMHSSQLSQRALPTLISETLQAQSAQVSAVSGATFTSQSYMQSLQSALAQANA